MSTTSREVKDSRARVAGAQHSNGKTGLPEAKKNCRIRLANTITGVEVVLLGQVPAYVTEEVLEPSASI